jgi:hypothetical protein
MDVGNVLNMSLDLSLGTTLGGIVMTSLPGSLGPIVIISLGMIVVAMSLGRIVVVLSLFADVGVIVGINTSRDAVGLNVGNRMSILTLGVGYCVDVDVMISLPTNVGTSLGLSDSKICVGRLLPRNDGVGTSDPVVVIGAVLGVFVRNSGGNSPQNEPPRYRKLHITFNSSERVGISILALSAVQQLNDAPGTLKHKHDNPTKKGNCDCGISVIVPDSHSLCNWINVKYSFRSNCRSLLTSATTKLLIHAAFAGISDIS